MLGVISGKIDLILLQSAEDRRQNEVRFIKSEERLDALEESTESLKHSRTWFLGAAAALGAISSGVLKLIGLGS